MWAGGILVLLGALSVPASAQSSTFNPARPPALPLAVTCPYMSTWQQAGSDGGNGGYLAGQNTTFWRGNATGWTGMIRVDGVAYTWMGSPLAANAPALVTQTSYNYTSTKSIFSMTVGSAVGLTVTFLSPVTPDDLKRSSFPASYLDVRAVSIDGKNHSVQLYSDVTAEWAVGDRSVNVEWDYGGTTGSPAVAYHHFYRQEQLVFSESYDQADWGNWYYATANTTSLTHQSGVAQSVRQRFISAGKLTNKQDTQYRSPSNNLPVFAFAVNLGTLTNQSVGTLFTINLAQTEAVQFEGGAPTNQSIPSLWTNYFSDDPTAVSFMYNDFSTQVSLATELDNQVINDAKSAGGSDYLLITSLAVRQAFATLTYAGTPDLPYVFLKEISSDGDIQTVDVIFPMHPILLYFNPTLLRYLLEPLFINQENGHWPYQYSLHDLGYYPNATGHNDGVDELQPLEECGNMVIMSLAYAQRTNDNQFLSEHYSILKQWNTYLINEALFPRNQISTDDFAGSLANQTNLALKGIIGIAAMAEIANRTGNTKDAKKFTNIAASYIAQWQYYGIVHDANPPHTNLAYNMSDTHGLLYNLYADRELGLGLVPQYVYEMQSKFYPTVKDAYGIPLDTRHTLTKADWEMYCAAIASKSTRKLFTSLLAYWINITPTQYPLTDLYDAVTADYPSVNGNVIHFIARPPVGGFFALLALKSAPTPSTAFVNAGAPQQPVNSPPPFSGPPS